MALCEKGSAGKVGLTNIQMTDSLNDEDEDSIYTAAKDDNMEETIVYYFGHAVGKGRGNLHIHFWILYIIHIIFIMCEQMC